MTVVPEVAIPRQRFTLLLASNSSNIGFRHCRADMKEAYL